MRVEEQYNLFGYFWLPGKEKNSLPGKLSIVDGGKIELELIGFFEGNIINAIKNELNVNRIIGMVENLGKVTLDRCFYLSKHAGGSITTSKILVHLVLAGDEWQENENAEFETFTFSFDCFEEWLGITGISTEIDDKKAFLSKISYSPSEKISFQLDNGMLLTIDFMSPTYSYPILDEVKMTNRAYCTLSSKMLLELNDFISIANQLTNFLCFAMDEIIAIKNVSATSSKKFISTDDNKYLSSIKIFYQSLTFSKAVPKNIRLNMLFRFNLIEHDPKKFFNNWLNAYDKLKPSFNLYFGYKNHKVKFVDAKFLFLIQGLESYHRRQSNETLMSKSEYSVLCEKIIAACPTDNKKWLNDKLRYGNEISLRTRLKKIISPFEEYFGTSKQRKILLNSIINMRNYLTHYNYDPILEANATNGRKLLFLNYKIEIIFTLHFLSLMGFSENDIKNIMSKSEKIQNKLLYSYDE